MRVDEFDFDLPAQLIAQEPPQRRGTSRLLVLDRATGALGHRCISDLPELLRAGDLLVVNNTRVFPARLLGRRDPSGGAVECLLVSQLEPADATGAEAWEALVHPGQKLKPGAHVVFEGAVTLRAQILERHFHGRRVVRLWSVDGRPVRDAVDAIGHVPLPPYIKRPDDADDRERYQTVFAQTRGSIAAPTAGLHFTPELLAALEARGIGRTEITLHVGYGTFQPIRVATIEDHRMESERYEISQTAADAITTARAAGRRIIAVGTTTTRTLESVAGRHDGDIVAGSGTTDLFVYPGFRFRVLDGLLTNFHLPQSSLLMLVSAFGGRRHVMRAYEEAVAHRYRFYSYGDAMVIL